jgi:5'-nucleotidase
MKQRPLILVTNDDGVMAPGIRHLWNALKEFADLIVVAPIKDQSAVSLSITLREPLRVEKIHWPEGGTVYGVSGTPVDCVKLAFSAILERPPTLVVSGINRGTNSGRNILYSGTVGGAIESVMHGVPGAAFSCYEIADPDYAITERHIAKTVKYLLANPLPEGSMLNVNFPPKKHAEPKGFKMTRQGREFFAENPNKRTHPVEGHDYYWLGAKLVEFDEEDDCDISWLEKGYIAAVPVHIGELTDHKHLEKNRDHFNDHMLE